jgi:hypothetical protein
LASNLSGGLTVAILAVALVLGGVGAGVVLTGHGVLGASTSTTTTTVSNSNSSSPYVVKLVVTTNSIFNSTAGDQPAYFVIGPSGLESAGKISVPAHRLIELVIVNYDDGNASLLQSSGGTVSGTLGGRVFLASNDNINASQGSSGINLVGGENVSSVPVEDVAHTFTVPTLNLNIPVPLSTTVVAYFTINQAGTYLWFCETACGDAAMSTTGWMQGSLVAS